MKIHEYQAKELFRNAGVTVPEGFVAQTPDEAVQAAKRLPSYPVVVKAQIHAGGRGKGGGVVLAADELEVRKAAEKILGMILVTQQTGSVGRKVGTVLVEQGLEIRSELYLSLVPDRATAGIMIIASRSGGMNIEEVAASDPDKIIRVQINPLIGIQAFHLRQAAFGLALSPALAGKFSTLLKKLYQLFIEKDCALLEINPLVITADDHLVALDAKIEIDSSALYRQQEIAAWRDENEEDPLELEASRAGLNYINLNGNIGNMVNGAGLAMATMDLIKSAGAEPANFLDVGGGASAEMVEEGFRIILSDPKVKGILINIFGGILRCDVLAEGVVQAARKTGISIPVVIRMEGTNVEKGRTILNQSGLNLINAVDLADAAKKIAEIASS
ncbi:MAG: ADP-forming succinate--CoA ligase subunit beta [Proteobacteria bacterium]|nr:ADP-forming succinate--CoA ligase subunit beta [Pseudomonadota bacterium]MBU1715584.1 ADP-forming succinate--CoA ligase subunit beta [Pseudomonadota bacterium]